MRHIFIIILILLSFNVRAQQSAIDSLENILISAKEDTNKVLVFAELSWKYLVISPEESKAYASKAIELSKNLSFKRGEVMGNFRLGDAFFRQADYANAIQAATYTLKLATQIKDYKGVLEAYYLMGNMYNFGLKNFDEALDYYYSALAVGEKINYNERVAAIKSSISWVYAIKGESLDSAHQLIDDAIIICKQLNLKRSLGHCYNSKGLIFLAESRADSALVYLNASNDMARQVDDFALISYNRISLGQTAIQQSYYDKAINIFNISLKEGREVNAKQVVFEAYKGLALAYELKNTFDSAYQYQKFASKMQDSLRGVVVEQNIAMIQGVYERERQETQIEALEKQNTLIAKEKDNQIILLIIILGFAGLVIFLVILNNGQKRRSNNILSQKNEEIENQNEELQGQQTEIAKQKEIVEEQNKQLIESNETKTKLFSIISHDLRSPIGGLKMILDLVNRKAVSPEEFEKLAPQLYDNVNSIHQTMENLFQWSKSQLQGVHIDIQKNNINNIINSQIGLFSEVAKIKEILISNELDNYIEGYFDKNQIELVFRNLINNAIKFTKSGGSIRIRNSMENDFIRVSVTDTGVGIEEETRTKIFETGNKKHTEGTLGEKGSGLGLALCKEMVEQNGGKITVESTLEKGSTFHVFLRKD